MTRYTVTCMEPGCLNKIHYTSEDTEYPMYCAIHRAEKGRHAGVINVKERLEMVYGHVPPKPDRYNCKSRDTSYTGVVCKKNKKPCDFQVVVGKCPGGFRP